MFGISPLGWVHTLGSLPAIPLAIHMFARRGRIVPRSMPGALYFVSMLIGATTEFLVAREPLSYGIGAATILLLLSGYGIVHIPQFGRGGNYFETIFLTLTTFLLMVPSAVRRFAAFRTVIPWLPIQSRRYSSARWLASSSSSSSA